MRNAQLLDWAKQNQQKLIVMAVLVVFFFGGAAVWIERIKTERNTAASIYYQSLAVVKDSDKKQLLNALIGRHFGTVYTALAQMQLARLDPAHAEQHLQAVINNGKSMPQWIWQARLDLARLMLANGKATAALAILKKPMGTPYEQLRQYLLAEASSDPADKRQHLELAKAAHSYDSKLRQRIDSELQDLAGQKPLISGH